MAYARSHMIIWFGSAALITALAFAPIFVSDYWLSYLDQHALLHRARHRVAEYSPGRRATSHWPSPPFSASVAYVIAVSYESMPLYASFALAGAVGVVLALIVGATTLRVSGIHFVIFTFGLTELIRELRDLVGN